jgi:hypothetical protein
MGDLTDRVGRNLKGIINVRLIGVSFRRSLGTRGGLQADPDPER